MLDGVADRQPSAKELAVQFDAETARQAQQAALAKTRADAEERRARALAQAAVSAQIIASQQSALDESRLTNGEILKAAAMKVAMDVLTGVVAIRTGTEAAAAVKALMEMGRLESNESTSNTGMTKSHEELLERASAAVEAVRQRQEEAAKADAATPHPAPAPLRSVPSA